VIVLITNLNRRQGGATREGTSISLSDMNAAHGSRLHHPGVSIGRSAPFRLGAFRTTDSHGELKRTDTEVHEGIPSAKAY
jgi:hypothetical protein